MTNEVLKCIETRRSVRRYRPEQIKDEELDAILRAGTYAASGMGRQPVKFVVLQRPEDVAELEAMNAAALGTPGAKRSSWSCWQTRASPPPWRTAALRSAI